MAKLPAVILHRGGASVTNISKAVGASLARASDFPDVVLLIRRDGVLLEHIAGHGVFNLGLDPMRPGGNSLESVWPEPVARILKQLVGRAIKERCTAQGVFHLEYDFQARVTAQGPDRAICVIRPAVAEQISEATPVFGTPPFDRRGFMRRFKSSMSAAALREQPTAVAVIQLDGIADIGQSIGNLVSEQVGSIVAQRLLQPQSGNSEGEPVWYMGQLSEDTLALVLETSDRDAIELCVTRACRMLKEPLTVGDATFHLTPYAGVAILGRDAATPKMLLDHARSCASEARRSGVSRICFFTDTLKLRSLARLDIARELSDAIAERAIQMSYVGRHDLATGTLVAHVAYLRWNHPLRGEVKPSEFVKVAEATGLARALSRCALERLRLDFSVERPGPDVRISFGALRHHILHDDFVQDMSRFLEESSISAAQLELRISERSFVALNSSILLPLQTLGVRLVVDEVGRGMTSLDRLARAPLWGLQLDRSWAAALHRDSVAAKVCRAGISVATALGLTPIATGVDDATRRDELLALGCTQGIGDLYTYVPEIAPVIVPGPF